MDAEEKEREERQMRIILEADSGEELEETHDFVSAYQRGVNKTM